MLANDLRKGDRIVLTNGWMATIEDNRKGNIRMATVEGFVTEMGSIYIWDIRGRVATDNDPKPNVQYLIDFDSGKMLDPIDLTPKQAKGKATVLAMGF
jgi:hypothetical protein